MASPPSTAKPLGGQRRKFDVQAVPSTLDSSNSDVEDLPSERGSSKSDNSDPESTFLCAIIC